MTDHTGNTKVQSKRSTKGTLAVVGTLFLLSGAFRIATDAGQVVAKEPESDDTTQISREEDAPKFVDLARPEHLTNALAAIRNREALLAEREQELAEREKTVENAEAAIREELAKLQFAEESLRKTISLATDAAENDVAQLTSVYANMKPKQAAALFEEMEPSFAAGFLFRMPPDSAARIMAGMTPEKAYRVSVELAGRNTDIPLE